MDYRNYRDESVEMDGGNKLNKEDREDQNRRNKSKKADMAKIGEKIINAI